MAKYCPVTKSRVTYLTCLECDDKVCLQPQSKDKDTALPSHDKKASGTKADSTPFSSQQIQAVSDAVAKIRFSRTVIDVSQLIWPEVPAKAIYDSTLINANHYEVSVDGRTTEVIKVLDSPILFDYIQLLDASTAFIPHN